MLFYSYDRHVQDGLDFDDECGFEEYGEYEEWIQKPVEEEEVLSIETSQETAVAHQLTTSEQEERQTFVITGNMTTSRSRM